MFHNNFSVRGINFLYNFFYKLLNNIKIDLLECDKKLMDKAGLYHSRGLGTVWLLNLKRLYAIFKNKYKFDERSYHFLDVGCGNGIPLIYAFKKFNFKSYSGFDFEKRYLKICHQNFDSSLKKKSKQIKVFKNNAKEFLIKKNKSYFIFMFNPFDGVIMKKFLKNNYRSLIKTNSVIAYCNYLELNAFKKYKTKIILNKKYKLALITFK